MRFFLKCSHSKEFYFCVMLAWMRVVGMMLWELLCVQQAQLLRRQQACKYGKFYGIRECRAFGRHILIFACSHILYPLFIHSHIFRHITPIYTLTYLYTLPLFIHILIVNPSHFYIQDIYFPNTHYKPLSTLFKTCSKLVHKLFKTS